MNRIISFLAASAAAVLCAATVQRAAAQTPASIVLMNLPIYQQTSASAQSLAEVAVLYDVTFAPGATSAGTTVQVQGPAGTVNLAAQADGSYQLLQNYPTAAAATAAFPNGTYTVTVGGGTASATGVTVSNGAAVAPVLITNYTSLQAAASQPVTPMWAAIAGAQATDFIDVEVDDPAGNQLFGAESGDLGLAPAATSLSIPALPTLGALAGSLSYGSVSATGANNGQTTVETINGFVVQFGLQLAIPSPLSQTVATGSTVVFNSGFTGVNATYQYNFNGTPIPGATSANYVLGNAQAANDGSYTLTVVDAAGTTTSAAATLTVVGSSNPGRLSNISVRSDVVPGAAQLIAGFVVGGAGTTGTQSLLIRGDGPALAATFGLSGVLADPLLQLWQVGTTTTQLASNQGWAGNSQDASVAAAVGAFPFTAGSLDSALYNSGLAPGQYTANVFGASGDSGVALAEIYDATASGGYTAASPRLMNVSGRAQVGTGANILIAGFVIGGNTAKTVLIRASGPALASTFGLTGTLAAPYLQIYSSGTAGATWTDTGWNGDPSVASIAAQVGAFSWNPSSMDSAILVTLPPGAYTAEVSGVDNSTGIALVEIYDVP